VDQDFSHEGLLLRHVSSIHLETAENLPWSLDGEYAPSTPVVDIVNRQQSLTMLL
jgi:diacylglycerol kinase family enzyme